MRISDWSSDVCSSDLFRIPNPQSQLLGHPQDRTARTRIAGELGGVGLSRIADRAQRRHELLDHRQAAVARRRLRVAGDEALDDAVFQRVEADHGQARSEEHTSELQSLMRISYAVFCLKKKTQQHTKARR